MIVELLWRMVRPTIAPAHAHDLPDQFQHRSPMMIPAHAGLHQSRENAEEPGLFRSRVPARSRRLSIGMHSPLRIQARATASEAY